MLKSAWIKLYIFISFIIVLAPIANAAIPVITSNPVNLLNTKIQKPNSVVQKIAVLGKDNRISLPKKHQAIAAGIGIIGQPGKRGWSCTAFCVAPNIIATNAHCIVRNPTMGKRLNLSKTLFILPAFKKNFGAKKYKRRITHPNYIQANNPNLSVFSGNFINAKAINSQIHDWAFTKLTHSVCKGRTLSFANTKLKTIQKAAKNNRVFMIGFHGDKKMKERLYSKNCFIRSRNNHKYFLKKQRIKMSKEAILLPHTCDAYKGSSGSPIFIETKQGPKVVGINLGSLRYERYRIKRNRYTKKIISRKKLKTGHETNIAIQPKAFINGLKRFKNETLLNNFKQFRRFQKLLKNINLYQGKVDGIFGQKTRAAIYKFEKRMHLPQIGLATKELLKLLEHASLTKLTKQ